MGRAEFRKQMFLTTFPVAALSCPSHSGDGCAIRLFLALNNLGRLYNARLNLHLILRLQT
jgi:hypothetical protein